MRSLIWPRCRGTENAGSIGKRACELILAQADIMEVSRQLELAVFPDATLDLVALYADA
jgi:hypothetical protein